MPLHLLLALCLLVIMPSVALADTSGDVDKAADRWVKDEIGRDPLVADSALDFIKDLIVGRQVSPVMGGILGRVNEALAQAEGAYGKPNKSRGLCGSAAVRQASGITADAKYSRMFRAFAGTLQDALGAAAAIPVNAAKWATVEGAKELEKTIGEAISKQQPEDYVLSKSQEGCAIEMRVVWNKADATYKFMIMGDCGCNEVRCRNFDTRKIALGRWSVSGGGKVTPEVKVKGEDAEVYFNISRISASSLVVNADCCGSGAYGQMDSWVDLPPNKTAISVGTPPAKPQPAKDNNKPADKPASGGRNDTTSSAGAGEDKATPKPIPPKPTSRPKPKPTPKAIKCPQCDPLRKQITETEAEKANAEQDKKDAKAAHTKKLAELKAAQAELSALEQSLKGEGGVGAESTDKTTGIKTTSYDNGKGQVEIKRFDKDGNQIGETEFRARPSTAERRKKRDAMQQKVKKLNEALGQLNHAVYYAEKRIKEADKKLESLRAQLAECIKKCKSAIEEPAKPKVSLGQDPKKDPLTSLIGDDWVEQIERATGETLTDEEIENYIANPEEALRFLGMDGIPVEDQPKTSLPPKKKPAVAPTKPTVSIGDDFEIELEDAITTSGTNAFDAREVEKIEVVPHGGHATGGGVTSPDDGYIFVPSPGPNTATPPEIRYTPSGNSAPIEVLPPPAAPFKVSVSGVIQATHTVRSSPCPQSAGSLSVTNTGNSNPIEIVSATASGTVATKLSLSPAGTTLRGDFNCSSPDNGTFSGQVQIVVRDTQTGKTQNVSAPASITVQGP